MLTLNLKLRRLRITLHIYMQSHAFTLHCKYYVQNTQLQTNTTENSLYPVQNSCFVKNLLTPPLNYSLRTFNMKKSHAIAKEHNLYYCYYYYFNKYHVLKSIYTQRSLRDRSRRTCYYCSANMAHVR